MSESSLVECPVCETEFDPTAAGGWCTNSECGEWRHEGADLTRGSDDTTDESTDETDASGDENGSEPPAADEGATEDPTPAIQHVGVDDTDESADETATGGSTDAAVDEPATTDDPETADAETEDSGAEDAAVADEVTCPNCAETVEADASFCPSCGEDVSAVEPGDGDDELTACPACETDVGPDASFCPSCGENLDAHREDEGLTACPSCGGDVEAEDSFCASCGEDLDTHRGSDAGEDADDVTETPLTESEPGPESLVLQTRGEELTVEDGDTVGRELRRIVTETGGDEDEAVRIHREHVRFVREDDRFYLVDLGRNPTALNGTNLEQGDREPVAPGDELSISDVVTLAVREP